MVRERKLVKRNFGKTIILQNHLKESNQYWKKMGKFGGKWYFKSNLF